MTPGETIRVEKLSAEAGKEVTFTALWAVGDAKEGQQPQVSRKASVVAEVVGPAKGPKIIVFKRRQKKAYKKMAGHRQQMMDVKIKSISLN